MVSSCRLPYIASSVVCEDANSGERVLVCFNYLLDLAVDNAKFVACDSEPLLDG
jgi:hypothetical protein